jgi:hypothetical protein
MDPNLMVLAIRGVVRVAAVARDAHEQHVRDAAIVLPDVFRAAWDDAMYVTEFFSRPAVFTRYIEPDPRRMAQWDLLPLTRDPAQREQAVAALLALADEVVVRDPLQAFPAVERAAWADGRGRVALAQWAEGSGPRKPWARVCLELADVAIEAVQAHPGVLGGRGAGDKYLRTLCGQLRPLLESAGGPATPGAEFATRAAAIALQAGLQALGDAAPEFVDESPLEQIVLATVKPLADRFATAGDQGAALHAVRDTVLGPLVKASVSALAAQPQALCGRDGACSAALAAVAQALVDGELDAAATPLRDLLSPPGLAMLARSALAAAAARPALLLGSADSAAAAARALVSGLAGAVADPRAPFASPQAAARVASAALDAFVAQASRLGLHDAAASAGQTLTRALGDVAGALRDAAAAPEGARLLTTVLDDADLAACAGAFVAQALQTPGMLAATPAGGGELRTLIVAVTRTLAPHAPALLAPADVLELAAAAVRMAALNPGRLVATAEADPMQSVAAKVVGSLLAQAAADAAGGRADGGVLFGATLREATEIALAAACGNARHALENHTQLAGLAAALDRLATRADRPIGQREWLSLFRQLAPRALADASGVDLRDEALLALLELAGTKP